MNNETNDIEQNKPLLCKKAVMIIAFKNFRDEEYFISKEILEEAKIEVKTASNKLGMAIGVSGGETKVNFLVENLKAEEFDAIIFIGGPGTLKNLDNENSYRIIRDVINQGKILASICISPVILARAGVLKNIKATVWSSQMDKSAVKILKENETIYEEKPVVKYNNIITADGPSSTKEFGKAIVEALK